MVHYVASPVYTHEARLAHIGGVLKFNAVILKSGDVGELQSGIWRSGAGPCRNEGGEAMAVCSLSPWAGSRWR